MSRSDSPFITDNGGTANMGVPLEAQLIRMLPYVSCRASHDPRVKKGSRLLQEGCCNIKSDGGICLRPFQQKTWPRGMRRIRKSREDTRSTLLHAAL